MKLYIGTKIIAAEPQEKDGKEGYKVEYEDGYISWSPKDVFETAYEAIADGCMNFGHAIKLLKMGYKLARKGWNGKGMFLYYVPANRYTALTDAAKEIAGEDGKVEYGAYIAMKTAQGNVVPWLASQTDVLSDDWNVVA